MIQRAGVLMLAYSAGCHMGAGAVRGRGMAPGEARPSPCVGPARTERGIQPQGTQLLGVRLRAPGDPQSVLFERVELNSLTLTGAAAERAQLDGGVLRLAPRDGAKERSGVALTGGRMTARDTGHRAVDLALCEIAPSPGDINVLRYRLEAFDSQRGEWANPCAGTDANPTPWAIALAGIWDGQGAHRASDHEFTFGCENGALAKCVHWGYKPWAQHDGAPLDDMHQACTRMARADYCGDGRDHTIEATQIEMWDDLGVQQPIADAERVRLSLELEATWLPDGAACMHHSRDGTPLARIAAECPARLVAPTAAEKKDCRLVRSGTPMPARLRNRSATIER